MSRAAEKALLPAGLRDILPPDAAFEAAAVERLMACVAGQGYERVKPPLIEFEEAVGREAFRTELLQALDEARRDYLSAALTP